MMALMALMLQIALAPTCSDLLRPSFPFYLPALGRDLLGPDRPCAQLPSLTSHPVTLCSVTT